MPLDRVRVGVVKPVEQGAGRLGARVAKIEFRLTAGDTDQSNELDLVVFLDRPVEEFEFPVRPPTDIEDPLLAAPLIDDEQPLVVGERLFVRR